MRVLQIVNIGFEAGGAEKSVRLIAEGLGARGHQVRVVATDLLAEGREVFADELVPAISGGPARRLLGYFWHRPAHRRVARAVREFRPDCVHLHTIGEFSPAVLAATRGCRRVLTVHGPEDWTRELLRWNLASAASGGRLTPGDRARYLYLRFLQRPAYLPRLRRVDRVLAPSRWFADAVRADVGSVPVFVLPNGIARSAAPAPVAATDRVLFVGRLERVKGVHVLLDAFRRLLTDRPQARLSVVGDGSDRARLEASAADLVADGRVTFHGWLPAEDVADRLREASVVALPSLWPENFPTVALEALQLGRPLVASRVGGLPELVGPDNGALVEPGDAAGLATALGALLGDRELLQRLGDGSAARADRYGVERFLDALEDHYEEVAAQ
ncbi:glycosyltransferase family 4 protein [Kitasatospora sp. NBC_00374]|uniref:glycosyltransferase family 4 protein n=1 Tax=Kitasatospora sp. NBC_00374 TaxID=2975964 RepID=UPI0030E5851E